MSEAATETRMTPYDLVGGAEGVQAMVDRFYDLMEGDARFADLRALHARDLTPMRASLTGFLSGWLGGPRDWFTENPGKCMMSLHSPIAVTAKTASQWVEAMRIAMKDAAIEEDIAERIGEAFEGMAQGMVRR